MECINCTGETRVLKTMKFETVVQRIRRCQSCLYVFDTYESANNGDEKIKAEFKPAKPKAKSQKEAKGDGGRDEKDFLKSARKAKKKKAQKADKS